VVDVANVMGSRPDGWWRDRAGAAVRLYSELAALAASGRITLPGDTIPEDTAAEAAAPGDAAAEDAAPDDAAPDDAAPDDAAPDDAAPDDAAPDDAAPKDAAASPDFVMVLEGAARAAASRIWAAEAARGPQGPAGGPAQPGQVRVIEARGSGDDAIVALVRELPGRRAVVTADRELRDRCAAAGAAVLGPAWLLGLMRQ
jgi:8-oxo-dGTP diphosphatase